MVIRNEQNLRKLVFPRLDLFWSDLSEREKGGEGSNVEDGNIWSSPCGASRMRDAPADR